jgi:hypothetical protein
VSFSACWVLPAVIVVIWVLDTAIFVILGQLQLSLLPLLAVALQWYRDSPDTKSGAGDSVGVL